MPAYALEDLLIEGKYANTVRLKDVVDVEQIVNRHELRKAGIEPGEIEVLLTKSDFSRTEFAVYDIHGSPEPKIRIVLGYETFVIQDEFGMPGVRVIVAHELQHVLQDLQAGQEDLRRLLTPSPLGGHVTRFTRTKIHARQPIEQEAIFFEAQQAAKEGFGREEHRRLAELIHHEGTGRAQQIDIAERPYAGLGALSRRPPEERRPTHPSGISDRDVHVKQHRRRA